ncbi:MAG: cyclophilin-like fold protein [Rouxiella aceris]|uniref:cyclophilin-like fold protein n=1 Tax=Rouxiella aceris TaxID=2703884 RepID=UPI0028459179|nr:cyclophilin-like fold protein [Rouxiella aceris]MDR3431706.1 cyclophilin-like fold protein [Rouxiella aceris]
MKYLRILLPGLFLACALAGHADTALLRDNPMMVTMIINGQQFDVRLHDNPAAKAFVNRLPLQLGMSELNGNEKFADLPHELPSSSVLPGTIQAGDIMLYGTQTLVLFYASFKSSYHYTPIGRVINPEKLPIMSNQETIWVEFSNH